MSGEGSDGHPAGTSRIRFVTACQQLLVLAVVAALLVPASDTISLDVRPSGPGGGSGEAALTAEDDTSTVPTAAVDPEVTEHALTAQPGVRARGKGLRGTAKRVAGGQRVVSEALPADGFAAVGVTWAPGEEVGEDDLDIRIRTREQGTWTGWEAVEYHHEHGPQSGSAEDSASVRPGTDAMFVGDVDRVQARIDAAGRAPADLRLAVIDPGEEKQTAQQEPDIDMGAEEAPSTDGRTAARVAPSSSKPRIFSRKQWGANERLRDKGSLSYGRVKAGFVHHTVNGNGYRKRDVAGIIRGIYAYHTKSRGWSDIGYNFLVDKFGRIWEGRAGGVGRAVVGAHTLGYNDQSFAGSAIGNFQTRKPPKALLQAMSRLMAWKLGLHGINPRSKNQRLHGKRFKAVSGHRDAGSTACPGRYLYERLPAIRKRAKRIQNGFRGRELESDLARGPRPDLVIRRKTDGRVILLPIVKRNGRIRTGKAVNTGFNMPRALNIWNAGDWDRDGHSDLMVRRPNGKIVLLRGNGRGKFRRGILIGRGFANHKVMAAVGDFTGDGYPDLMGRPKRGTLKVYPGKGTRGLRKPIRVAGKIGGKQNVAIGRWNRGGAPDTFIRTKRGLWALYGNGPGRMLGKKRVKVNMAAYNWFVGVSDVHRGGRQADVIARERRTGRLFVLHGKRNGTFKSRSYLGRKVGSRFQVVN